VSADAPNQSVNALAAAADGRLFIGGWFSTIGSQPAAKFACWDGTSWQNYGAAFDGGVNSLLWTTNGLLVAGGEFYSNGPAGTGGVCAWNGTAWHSIGAGTNGTVHTLCEMPDGSLVAGGRFFSTGSGNANRIARWTGSSWAALGAGTDGPVRALLALPNGDLVAGGEFTTAGNLPANRTARWNGSTWSAFAPALDNHVLALTRAPRGDVWLGGEFTSTATAISAHLAEFAANCPATVATHGASCSSSTGPVTLQANGPAWAGSTFRATANGLPNGSLAIAIFGFSSASTTLVSLLPQAGIGCMLLASPDLVDFRVPSGGTAQTALPLPNLATIAGFTFFHQVGVLEFGTAGAVTYASSSGALQLVIGAL
jgi:hypothetical protein